MIQEDNPKMILDFKKTPFSVNAHHEITDFKFHWMLRNKKNDDHLEIRT